MNPIEDESVVIALIKRCKGAVRIVDVSEKYPKLRRAAGLYDWKVVNEKNEVIPSFNDVPDDRKRYYRETMWPSTPEECKEIGIEHAMRFLPHHQDTGGFFVCVLEKVADIPLLDQNEDEIEVPTEVPTETPTEVPTEVPAETPTETPAGAATEVPTEIPVEEEQQDGDLIGITEEPQYFSLLTFSHV